MTRPSISRPLVLMLALLLTLGGFAWLIASSQRSARAQVEQRFETRAEMAAAQLETFRAQVMRRQAVIARRWLRGREVSAEQFELAVAAAGHEAAVLLDARGVALRVAPANRSVLGTRITPRYPHLRAAVAGRPAVSPVVPSAARGEPIVAFAMPFATPAGRRVFSSGYPVADTPLQALAQHAVGLDAGRFYLLDDSGRVMLTNAAAASRSDRMLVAAVASRARGHFDGPGDARYFAQLPVTGTPWRVLMTIPHDVLYRPLSGSGRWLPWVVLGTLGAAGLLGLRLVGRRRRAEALLAAAEQLHQRTIRNLPDTAICVFDHDLRFTLVEGPVFTGPGRESERWIGKRLHEVVPAERVGEVEPLYRRALAGETATFEWATTDCDSVLENTIGPLRDESGRIVSGLVVSRDVTERKRLEDELRRLADEDTLTGLWNRRRFEEELGLQTARCRRHGERAALLLLDLDNFKDVNDSRGHSVGDRLLKHVALVLEKRARASDVVARLGGDEFAVLLSHVSSDEAALVAEGFAEALREAPLQLADDSTIAITASIGIAFLDGYTAGAEQALIDADVAMYDAKAAGRDGTSRLRAERSLVEPALRVFHCDDSAPYRRLLREMLRAQTDLELVGAASDVDDVLASAPELRPDVIVFDASLGIEDPDVVPELRSLLPETGVLVLSGADTCPNHLAEASDGFINKARTFDEIAEAIRQTGLATRRARQMG